MRSCLLPSLLCALVLSLVSCGSSNIPAAQPTKPPQATALSTDQNPATPPQATAFSTTQPQVRSATNAPTPSYPPQATPPPPTQSSLASPTVLPNANPTRSADVAQSILASFQRTRQASQFRLEQYITGVGGLENLGFGSPSSTQAQTITHILQQCNGADCEAEWLNTGPMFSSAGLPNSIHTIIVQGDSYVHGPILSFQLPENRWYRIPQTDNPFARSELKDPELFQRFDENSNSRYLSAFSPVKDAQLDGISCALFSSVDPDIRLYFLKAFIGENLLISNVTHFLGEGTSDVALWACADGYFHQLDLHFSGHDQTRPDIQVERTYRLHLFGYTDTITITPPDDALTTSPAK